MFAESLSLHPAAMLIAMLMIQTEQCSPFLKKKIVQSFHDVQITAIEIFLQGKILIPIMLRWMAL